MDKKTESRHSGIALAIKRSRAALFFIAALAVLWIGAIFAAEDVFADTGSFLYITEDGKTVEEKITYSLITADTQTLSEGWNVVQGEVTCGFLNCGTESKILLTDKSKLTTMIKVAEGQTLSVYGQSTHDETMGQIICDTQSQKSAGIGGWKCHAGTIVINGGWIIAGEDCSGPCIGGCEKLKSGDITINGGRIEAVNNYETYACIGGAYKGGGGKVTINNGMIITSGPGVGIGAGNESQPVKVTINGGEIKANNSANTNGVGIGAGTDSVPCVIINGGRITTGNEEDTRKGIGIGGVSQGSENDEPEIKILGGTVKANHGIGFAGGHGSYTGGYDIVLGHSDAKDKISFVSIVGNVTLNTGQEFLYLDGDYTGEQFKPEDITTSLSAITLVPMKCVLQYDLGDQQTTLKQGANPEHSIKLYEGAGLSGPDGGTLYRWKINGQLYKGGEGTIIKKSTTAEAVWTIPVTVNGIRAKTRTYDGTTQAEPEINGDVLTGIDEADIGKVEITAQPEAIRFVSANAGKNVDATIDFTKLELAGEMAEKYFLKSEGSLLNTSGDIDPRPVTIRAENKTCLDLLHKTPLSWQIEDAQNNWYDAVDPDIAFLITDSSGRTAKIDQLKFGERYTIEPAWAAGKENKNYSTDFVAGQFDTAHTWDAGKVTKEATEKATGVRTYSCTVCGTERTEPIAKLPAYEAKDAAGNAIQTLTWQKGSGKPFDFTIKRSERDEQTYERFESMDVDGEMLSNELYEKSPGSVNLSIKPEYLETLALGDHDIKVNFDDGNSELKLRIIAATEPAEESDSKPTSEPEIKPTTVPDDSKDVTTEKESKGVKTADESNAFLWFAVMSAAIFALISSIILRRRIMR